MEYNALLTDLPASMRIDCEGEAEGIGAYVRELGDVHTENDLELFTAKWKALWMLPYGRKDAQGNRVGLSETEESIVYNTYDKAEALNCITEGRQHACSHVENGNHCVGIDILLPPIFFVCSLLSEKYGCPVAVSLIQLQKSLDNLPDSVASQVF